MCFGYYGCWLIDCVFCIWCDLSGLVLCFWLVCVVIVRLLLFVLFVWCIVVVFGGFRWGW